MTLTINKLNEIKQLVNHVSTIQEDTTEKLAQLKSVLANLTPEELNTHVPIGHTGRFSSISELVISEYLDAIGDKKKSIENLLFVLDYLFNLNGFNINSKNPGSESGLDKNFALLHCAVSQRVTNNSDITHVINLLNLFDKYNADFNVTNAKKETAMHIVIYKHLNEHRAGKLINELHQLGCGLNRMDSNDQTVLDLTKNKDKYATHNFELAEQISHLGGMSGFNSNRTADSLFSRLNYQAETEDTTTQRDSDGNTAAHLAVIQNQPANLDFLCAKGANLTIVNNSGRSVLDYLLNAHSSDSFIAFNYIKTAVQSQGQPAMVQTILCKAKHDLRKQEERRVVSAHTPKIHLVEKVKEIQEKIQSDKTKVHKSDQWQEQLEGLCSKPRLVAAGFKMHMNSSKATISGFRTAFNHCDEKAKYNFIALCKGFRPSKEFKNTELWTEIQEVAKGAYETSLSNTKDMPRFAKQEKENSHSSTKTNISKLVFDGSIAVMGLSTMAIVFSLIHKGSATNKTRTVGSGLALLGGIGLFASYMSMSRNRHVADEQKTDLSPNQSSFRSRGQSRLDPDSAPLIRP